MGGEPTDAGRYTVEIVVGSSNYVVTSNSSTDFTINTKRLTVTWPSNKTLTYNGNPQSFEALSVIGEVTSGDADIAYSYGTTLGSQAPTNQGSYTVTISCNSNYSISSNKTDDFTIKPKQLTVTWPGTATKTYTGSAWSFVATVSGTVNSEDAGASYTYRKGNSNLGSSAPKNVGEYTATVGVSNPNYTISTADATKSFSITKKTLTVSGFTNKTVTYTGSQQSLNASSINGEVSSGDVGITYWYQNANGGNATQTIPTNAGTYTVTIQCSGNYVLSTTIATLTISPKALTVTWSSANVLTYDGTSKAFQATSLKDSSSNTVTATQAGVTYEYKTEQGTSLGSTAPSAVGTYTVTIKTNSNYTVTSNATKTFRIVEASSGT